MYNSAAPDEVLTYLCEGEAPGCRAVRPRTGGGRRDGVFLGDFLMSRAAFDTLGRAKHWMAFHVAQTIYCICKNSAAEVLTYLCGSYLH